VAGVVVPKVLAMEKRPLKLTAAVGVGQLKEPLLQVRTCEPLQLKRPAPKSWVVEAMPDELAENTVLGLKPMTNALDFPDCVWMEKRADGELVPTPTRPWLSINRCGDEVPSSPTTKTGAFGDELACCSIEKRPHGVELPMPTP